MTLTGVTTVGFGITDPVNDGTIQYQWYEVGVGPVQEGDNAFRNRYNFTYSTKSCVMTQDKGRQFYLESSYLPTTSTGSGINQPF